MLSASASQILQGEGPGRKARAATTSTESTSGSTTRRFFCGGLATSSEWLQGATCATELPPAPRTDRSAASLFSRAGPEQRADDAQIVATSTCKRAPAQSSNAAQRTAAAACAAWKPSGTLSQYVAASQAATDRSGPRAAVQAARAWRSARGRSGIAATAARACAAASYASDAFTASCLAKVIASSTFILAVWL